MLRLRRQFLMLDQKELARRAGVNEMSIVGWENGWHFPRLSKLRPVLEVLGLDEQEVLSRR
ncbi:MAG: helix-turn-helix transcriptional regulator [Chloroflexota bacterium]